MTWPSDADVFARSGLAAVSDLKNPEYLRIHSRLEELRSDILRREKANRGPNDPVPLDIDPFWSRIWEYPYTFHHLVKLGEERDGDAAIKVADLGSGFTAFPFAVSQLGHEVMCLDINAACGPDLERVASAMDQDTGSVTFGLIEDGRFPVEDGELDAVYSVSVLEHIPDFRGTIEEISRVLRPGGTLVLTIDLDFCGFMDIGTDKYHELRGSLAERFTLAQPELTVHPLDILQPRNGPVPYMTYTGFQKAQYKAKEAVRLLLGKEPRKSLPNLAVWGGVMTKKNA